MRFSNLAFCALAVGLLLFLTAPLRPGTAFSLDGTSLDLDERTVRVFNNFADPETNDDTTQDPAFPGATGAELAIWKAISEWGSVRRPGTDLGDGAANFDANWQGNATSAGSFGDNVISAIDTCPMGVYGFVQRDALAGWRMRLCDSSFVFLDGSGGNISSTTIDLQAAVTRLYGVCLGLGDSFDFDATMRVNAIPDNSLRSIEADDIAGLQAIYGAAAASKPVVASVTNAGATVTITGSGFAPTGNEIWFTNFAATNSNVDPTVRVTDVASTAGGTQIVVDAPSNAGAGDVLVKIPGTGFAALSNAVGVDLPDLSGVVSIDSISPPAIDPLIPGTDRTVTILGTGFLPTSQVAVNGVALGGVPNPVQFVSITELRLDMPQVDQLGPATITVTSGANSDSSTIDVVAPSAPLLQLGTGDAGQAILQVFGIDVAFASAPGDLVYLVYSTSNVPSVLPGVVSLGLGNGFLDIPPVGVGLYLVPAKGWDAFNLPVSGVTSLPTVFCQGVRFTGGPPYAETNLQSFLLL